MQPMYYIGLDVHKRTISYCVKDGSGAIQVKRELAAKEWPDMNAYARAKTEVIESIMAAARAAGEVSA